MIVFGRGKLGLAAVTNRRQTHRTGRGSLAGMLARTDRQAEGKHDDLITRLGQSHTQAVKQGEDTRRKDDTLRSVLL